MLIHNRNSGSAIVSRILETKKITEYLEKKGHFPVKRLAGKLSYLCPFPDHNETLPSFFVWTNAEFENFRCFGCSRCYHIIHLVSGLENISYKEAITRLSDGMEISVEEDIKFELEQIDKQFRSKTSEPDLYESMISISNMCRSHLEDVEFDESESKIIDRYYAKIDEKLLDYDFEWVIHSVSHLPELVRTRREKYEQEKEIRLAKLNAQNS